MNKWPNFSLSFIECTHSVVHWFPLYSLFRLQRTTYLLYFSDIFIDQFIDMDLSTLLILVIKKNEKSCNRMFRHRMPRFSRTFVRIETSSIQTSSAVKVICKKYISIQIDPMLYCKKVEWIYFYFWVLKKYFWL